MTMHTTTRRRGRICLGATLIAAAGLLLACGSDDLGDDPNQGDGGSGSGTTASGGGGQTTTTTGDPGCGNLSCDSGESCQSCGDDCASYGSLPADTDLDTEEEAFLVLINDHRGDNGVAPLAGCRSLHRAAQGHSEDMRDNDYFDHNGLDGSKAWDRACNACFEKGCGPQTAMGENIAAGHADAASTFQQWKSSPGHNENMLDPGFNFLGIGRALNGGEFGSYWTNVFAGADEPSCY